MVSTATKLNKDGTPRAKPGPKGGRRAVAAPFKSKGAGKCDSLPIGLCLEIINTMEMKGWTQKYTAEHFSKLHNIRITQSTICRWAKQKEKWIAELEKNPHLVHARRVREVEYPALDAAVVKWVTNREDQGQAVTGPLILEKAARLRDALGIPKEKLLLSVGWLDAFKKRHGICKRVLHGEAGSCSVANAQEERVRLRLLLQEFAPEDRYNADETGFFFRQLYSYSLGTRALPGCKLEKTRLTVLVTSNQTGTDKLPLLFIGRAACPRSFKKKTPRQLGIKYYSNKTAWMTGAVFASWLEAWDRKLQSQGRKVLLLIDNFSGHKWNEDRIKNIRVEFLAPNLTPFVQPMDAGIIRTLKAHYKRMLLQRSLDLEEGGSTEIFKIDALEAIRILEEAWETVNSNIISNCWKHTGITLQEML